MAEEPKFGISLYIEHPLEDLNKSAQLVNLTPFRIWKSGEPRMTPKGTALEGVYKESYLCLRITSVEGQSASDAILDFLDKFEKHNNYWNDLLSTGGKFTMTIFKLTDENYGDEFDWKLLARLAESKITLSIDMY